MAKRGKVKKGYLQNEDERPFKPRKYTEFMLIVCEDEKTEPYYFGRFKGLFPPETVYLKQIGTGKKPLGIVKQAIKERNEISDAIRKSMDYVWVVFDRDDEGNNERTLTSFNQAWALALAEKIDIAFSNEVFELWLLLHLVDVKSELPVPRAEIYKRLETAIRSFSSYDNFIYQHGKTTTEIIDAIWAIGDEQKAIRRADKLLEVHKSKGNKPIDANPSTTVHLLVRQLRDLISWYSC